MNDNVFAIPKFGNNNDPNYNTFHETFVDLLIIKD